MEDLHIEPNPDIEETGAAEPHADIPTETDAASQEPAQAAAPAEETDAEADRTPKDEAYLPDDKPHLPDDKPHLPEGEPYLPEDAAFAPDDEPDMAPSIADYAEDDAPAQPVKRKTKPTPVEPFVPTDAFTPDRPRRKKKRRKRKRYTALFIVLIALVLLLAAGAFYLFRLSNNPESFFAGSEPAVSTPTPTPAEIAAPVEAAAEVTPVPSPTPTLNPYEQLEADADAAMMQNIVNVLVVGVDYAEERETWNGKKEWHSDVMMVLAVNFDENRVDLISLPRDTYANIPGVKGIYKLNASLNCGGGMDAANGAGFLKTCEACSWMLGGIPINYYYAVTMPAVKQLVDTVGGVDYDLEMSYTMMGRRYKKGAQHLDGQGVLDYLRVRKNIAESGDGNRVNRQKKMMVALFETMQQQNLIVKIPEIVGSFSGQMFTNCSASQTAALATFAYNLDKENIGMYSMTSKGGGNTNIFNWNFCLTDQENRVAIIKQIYGVDVPVEKEYTPAYAKYRWASMCFDKTVSVADKVVAHAANVIATGILVPDGTAPGGMTTADPFVPDVVAPSGVPDAGAVSARPGTGFTVTRLTLSRTPGVLAQQQYTESGRSAYDSLRGAITSLQNAQVKADREAEKYLAGEDNSFTSASASLVNARDNVVTLIGSVASYFDYTGSTKCDVYYEEDTDFNEVTVDFN